MGKESKKEWRYINIYVYIYHVCVCVCVCVSMEEEMATCSSILARRISWTEEPGRLQSMGLQRVGHD